MKFFKKPVLKLQKYGKIESGKVIEKGEPLFMRLDIEEEINYIKEGMKA